MCNSNKFVLLIISQDICVDSVTWDKGFVLRGIGDVKFFLIMNRLLSFYHSSRGKEDKVDGLGYHFGLVCLYWVNFTVFIFRDLLCCGTRKN